MFQVVPGTAAERLQYETADELLVEGPAGTGKTISLLAKCVSLALTTPNGRFLIARKSRKSLNQTVLETLERKLLPLMFHSPQVMRRQGWNLELSRANRESYTIRNTDMQGTAEIVLGGLDNLDRIMSGEFDVVFVFEATELTQDDFEKLTTRLRNNRLPFHQIAADCNPAYPQHWLNLRFKSKPADGSTRVRLLSRHEDNPALYDRRRKRWTPFGRDYLNRLENLTGPRYLRLRKGIWAAAEGLVYPEFDRAVHVKPQSDFAPIPADWFLFWSVDFGIIHPFVATLWAIDPMGRLIRVREVYRTGKTVDENADAMLKICPLKRAHIAVCDHQLQERLILERMGFATIPADKSVTAGINEVKERLRVRADGLPGLIFLEDGLFERDPSLVESKKPIQTLDEFDNYRWNESREMPVKENDDGLDTVRYAVKYANEIGQVGGDAIEPKERRVVKRGSAGFI